MDAEARPFQAWPIGEVEVLVVVIEVRSSGGWMVRRIAPAVHAGVDISLCHWLPWSSRASPLHYDG